MFKPATDEEFFGWVENESDGFFVNVAADPSHSEYPKLHKNTHRAARTRKRENYTDGKPYSKWCAMDISELEAEAKKIFSKALIRCKQCNP
jgi:hypothetical protein